MGPQLQTFFTQGLRLTKQPLSHEGEETGALEVHPPPSQWLSLERTSLPPTIQWPELWPHSRVHTYHMPGRQLLKYMHSSSGDGHSLQAQHKPPPWQLCNSVWALAMVASLLFLQHPGS